MKRCSVGAEVKRFKIGKNFNDVKVRHPELQRLIKVTN